MHGETLKLVTIRNVKDDEFKFSNVHLQRMLS